MTSAASLVDDDEEWFNVPHVVRIAIRSLAEALARERRTTAEMSGTMSTWTKLLHTLEARVAGVEQAASAQNRKVIAVESDIASVRQLVEQVKTASERRAVEAHGLVAEHQRRNDAGQREWRVELETAQKEWDGRLAAVDTATRKVTNVLEGAVHGLRSQQHESKAALAVLHGHVDSCRRAYEGLEGRVGTVETAAATSMASLQVRAEENTRALVASLHADISETRAAVGELERQRVVSDDAVREIQLRAASQHDECAQRVRKLNDKLKLKLAESGEMHNAALAAVRAEVDGLRIALGQCEGRTTHLTSVLTNLQHESASGRAHVTASLQEWRQHVDAAIDQVKATSDASLGDTHKGVEAMVSDLAETVAAVARSCEESLVVAKDARQAVQGAVEHSVQTTREMVTRSQAQCARAIRHAAGAVLERCTEAHAQQAAHTRAALAAAASLQAAAMSDGRANKARKEDLQAQRRWIEEALEEHRNGLRADVDKAVRDATKVLRAEHSRTLETRVSETISTLREEMDEAVRAVPAPAPAPHASQGQCRHVEVLAKDLRAALGEGEELCARRHDDLRREVHHIIRLLGKDYFVRSLGADDGPVLAAPSHRHNALDTSREGLGRADEGRRGADQSAATVEAVGTVRHQCVVLEQRLFVVEERVDGALATLADLRAAHAREHHSLHSEHDVSEAFSTRSPGGGQHVFGDATPSGQQHLSMVSAGSPSAMDASQFYTRDEVDSLMLSHMMTVVGRLAKKADVTVGSAAAAAAAAGGSTPTHRGAGMRDVVITPVSGAAATTPPRPTTAATRH